MQTEVSHKTDYDYVPETPLKGSREKEREEYQRLLKKRERILKVLYEYDGTSEDILEVLTEFPEKLYRALDSQDYRDAMVTLKTFVRDTAYEISRFVRNPESQIVAYHLIINGLDLAHEAYPSARIPIKVVKSQMERLLEKEKGKLKKKQEGYDKVREIQARVRVLEELVGE